MDHLTGLELRISGRWGHFRRPETNNTPLTHDFITKTALLGLMGAVLGYDRPAMRELFPVWSEGLLYGVRIEDAVKKQSWAFTLRRAEKQNDPREKAPRPMEFLRHPNYTVVIAAHNEACAEDLRQFDLALQRSEAHYTPVLGLHNCPAELKRVSECSFTRASGAYRTTGFVLRNHRLSGEFDTFRFRLGFDRIPTVQDSSWWNLPGRYVEVAYPSEGAVVSVVGDHYRSSGGEAWCLV